jgi:hypothetical protein
MEPPKATVASASILKKQCNKLTTRPAVEETQEASSLALRFPEDYIPLRKSSTKIVNL